MGRVVYIFKSALRGLRASPLTTGISVATLAVTLLLCAAFLWLLENMQQVAEDVGSHLLVTAYLEDSLKESDRRALQEKLLTVEGVESVEFISKAQALERFEENLAKRFPLLEFVEENPLPASLELALAKEQRSVAGVQRIAAGIEGLRGIRELRYGLSWVENYARVISIFRLFALGLASVLAFVALLIVANTIRLAIYARRDEIEVLSLVGATRSFISLPFLLEGFLQGVLGAVLALVIFCGVFYLLSPIMESGLAFLLGHSELLFLSVAAWGWIVLAGACLGVLGSLFALVAERSP